MESRPGRPPLAHVVVDGHNRPYTLKPASRGTLCSSAVNNSNFCTPQRVFVDLLRYGQSLRVSGLNVSGKFTILLVFLGYPVTSLGRSGLWRIRCPYCSNGRVRASAGL